MCDWYLDVRGLQTDTTTCLWHREPIVFAESFSVSVSNISMSVCVVPEFQTCHPDIPNPTPSSFENTSSSWIAKSVKNTELVIHSITSCYCVLRFLDLLDQIWKELLVIVFEVYLKRKGQGDQALKELLVPKKLLRFGKVTHLVRDFFNFFEKDVVRTILYDLRGAGDGAALHVLALGLFDHV